MGYFLAFVGKLFSYLGVSIEECEPLIDGPNISDNSTFIHDSSSSVLVSRLSSAIVPDSWPKEDKPHVAKEEYSCGDQLILIQQSNNLVSSSETSCLISGSSDAALEKTTVSVYLQSEELKSCYVLSSSKENNGSCDYLGSDSFIYNDDDDSLKENLTHPQEAIAEPDLRPVKSKKKASKRQSKARKISLLNNLYEQFIGELSTSSHSDPLSSNPIEQVSNMANGISVSSIQGSRKKGKLVCPQNTTTVSESEPLESKKKASRHQKRKAMKLSSLNIQNEPLIWESSRHSYSDPRSNSVEHVCIIANDVSVLSSEGTSENGRLLVKKNSTLSVVDVWPKEDKPQAAIEESSCGDRLILIQQSNNRVSSSETSCLINGSTNAALEKTTVGGAGSTMSGYLQSEVLESRHIRSSFEKIYGSGESVGSDSIVYKDGDDSLKENPTSLQKTITKPDSIPVKSKKRRQPKALQISLLDNQNEKLTGEPSTSSKSDHQNFNSITPTSSPANAVSVPSSGSGTNEYIQADIESSPNFLGSQKTQLFPQNINYDDGDDSSKVKLVCQQNTITVSESKQLKSKKKASRRQKRKAMKFSSVDIQNESDPGSNSIEHVCVNANDVSVPSSQGTSENEHLLVESNSMPSMLDSWPKEDKPRVAKEEYSCGDHLILIQQSNNLVSSSETSCLISGSSVAALEKTTVSGYLQSEDLKSCYIQSSSHENNGACDYIGSNSFIYNDNDDSLKENLTRPQEAIAEPDLRPLKSKKKASKQQSKARKISLLNNLYEQFIGELSTSSHSDPLSSNPIEQVSDMANGISVSSIQGSGKKGKLVCPQNTTTLSESEPLESKKKASRRQKRKAMKLSSLNIQNEQLILESSRSSYSNPRSNSVEHVCIVTNDVSVLSSEGTSENGHLLVKKNSTPSVVDAWPKEDKPQVAIEESSCGDRLILIQQSNNHVSSSEISCLINGSTNAALEKTTVSGYLQSEVLESRHIQSSFEKIYGSCESVGSDSIVYKDGDDSLKENPTSLQKTITKPDSIPVKSRKRRQPKALQISLLDNQNEKLTGEPKPSTDAALDKYKSTVSEYLQSEEQEARSNTNSFEENNGSRDSLGSDSFTNDVNAESPKEILICQKKIITEPVSMPVKSKKKASKRKGMKISLLNNQNEQIIVEASTSDPQRLYTLEQIGNKASAISVPCSQLLGSSESGQLLAEPDYFPKVLGYQKTTLRVPQKVTSDIDANKIKVKLRVAKEELSWKTPSLVNGSTNAALKKFTMSGNLATELRAVQYKQECHHIDGTNVSSPKITLVLRKTTSAIDSEQQEVKLWVPKEKSSCTDQLFSIQKSLNLVRGSKTTCLVNGSTHDDAPKKATQTSYLPVDFSAAPGENESRQIDSSVEGNDGSLRQDKASSSSANVAELVERKIGDYCSSQRILLVGEGNFSFSACLARAFGSATNMVATSLNSKAYLECNYKDAMRNISELRMRGCNVFHEVDATAMANHSSMRGQLFDVVIYNFPHCGDFSCTKKALRKNQTLVILFMKNSSRMIKEDGEIHIRHKISPSFSEWNLKGLASEAGLVLIEEAHFNLRKFKGYSTKYGFEGVKFGSGDTFNCYPCRTYKFALPGQQKRSGRQNSKLNA